MSELAPQFHPLPAWARWSALIWLVIWVPTYLYYWGSSSFLFLCDLAVLLACAGVLTSNALLISSQALSSLVVDTAWTVDIAWKLLSGRHLIGGTEYFFDPLYPLVVRLMSTVPHRTADCFAVVITPDRVRSRALRLQSVIAVAALIASRFANPHKNINFAFTDPFFGRSWGPAPVHLAVILAPLILLIYVPTHIILKRCFRSVQITLRTEVAPCRYPVKNRAWLSLMSPTLRSLTDGGINF